MIGRRAGPTRPTLLGLGAASLVLTAVLGFFGWWAYARAHEAIPAIAESLAAHAALVEADAAVVRSFDNGEARLVGSGEEYRNQIGIASQNLTQAAQDNVAADEVDAVGDDNPSLRLVEGQLAVYMSTVEQAVSSLQDDAPAVGVARLWEASRLLHQILRELDQFRDAQRDSGTMTMWDDLSWILPAVLLLGLLVCLQIFLNKRFRRRLNPALVGATLLLLGLVCLVSGTFVTEARVADTLNGPVAGWGSGAVPDDPRGQMKLKVLLAGQCDVESRGCGETVARWNDKLSLVDIPAYDQDAGPAEQARAADGELMKASDLGDYEFLIPVLTVLIGGLVVVGLYPRYEEYRYRAR